ncbi:MAG TPA: hypothetical protein VGF38_09765 [Ktedonobacterales bacterium]|jgi:hypothetical protein
MQVADAMAAATPITWETCIIDYWLQRETGSFGTSLLQFFADANRPQLTYVAEQSDEYAGLYNFPNPSGSEDVAALKQLINPMCEFS